MRFLRRALVGLFLLSVTVGLLTLAFTGLRGAIEEKAAQEDRPRAAQERVFAANVVTVRSETVAPILETFGEVLSRRTLEVRARSSGAIVELGEGVEDGGSAREGQLLFRVDPVEAEVALRVAEADLADAENELADAERARTLAEDDVASARVQAELQQSALARQRDLERRGVGTSAAIETAGLAAASADQAVLSRRQALAQATARVAQAQTALARRRIALSEAERAVRETEIRAPFAGVLADVDIGLGAFVVANEQLARLIDPAMLEVRFRLSTQQYARLVENGGDLARATVTVALDVDGFAIESAGRISRESGAVGEGQTGRQLFARLDTAQGFRPGDFVSVTIREPEIDRVARLPAGAVSADGTVLVLGEEDRLSVVEVDLLRRQGDAVLVRAPDLEGREVVADRGPMLGAGIKVRPVRPRAPGEAAMLDGPEMLEGPEMLALSDERRARLMAFVEASDRMPQDAKDRVLTQLSAPEVPIGVVERIERRMGG